MNIATLSLLAALFPLSSLADAKTTNEDRPPLACYETGKADAGYVVKLTSEAEAVLQEVSIAGAQDRATLKCKRMRKPKRNVPDALVPTRSCSGKGSDGKQYHVQMSSGGLWFHIVAHVGADGKTVARELLCKNE